MNLTQNHNDSRSINSRGFIFFFCLEDKTELRPAYIPARITVALLW